MFANTKTQQFGKISTLIFNNLSKDNDFIFMKRSKILEGCDSNIPQFLVIIYGRFTESPKVLFITLDQEENMKLENFKKIFYEKVLLNLHKLTDGKVTELVLGNCEYYVFLQEYPTKESLEDSKFEGLYLLTKDNENYLIPKEPVQHSLCISILSALISCSNDLLEKHEIHGNNLLEVIFHGQSLKDLRSSSVSNIITTYEFPDLKLYTSLKFWEIVKNRKDCGLFLMRYANSKTINENQYKKEIAKNLNEITPTTRFLIDDNVAFEDVCKIRNVVHEVISEPHNRVMTWIRSSNSTDLLQNFIFSAYTTENENIDNSIKILHGLPGSGKSTYLKKIAKDLQTEDETRWINFLDGSVLEHILHLHPDLFSKSCTEVLYQLFQIKNNWEKLVFHYGSQILGRIVCLIDNLDDMPKSILPNFAQFLKQVNEEYPKLVFWITARTEFKDIIVKHVPIFSHDLPVFNKEEKKKFLKSCLPNIDDDALKDILQKVKDENTFFTSAFDVISKFDVTPYDLWLCSEKVKRYGKDTSLYLLDAYDFYVEQKMNEAQEKDLEELCRSAAFNYVKTSPILEIKIQRSSLFENVFEKYKDRKILEYLTARFFKENTKFLTENLIFHPQMKFIMYLLDKICFRKSALGTSVLNGNLEKVLILTETEDAKLIRDNLGRNLAHIVRDEHSGILEHLLEKGVSLNEEDNILHCTPERYAASNNNYMNLDIMLKNMCQKEYLQNIPQFFDCDSDLFFEDSFVQEHFHICKFILDNNQNFKITPSILHTVTIEVDNYPKSLVLKILNMAKEKKLNEQQEYLDKNGENAIHNVSRHSNGMEIMKILVEDLQYNIHCKNHLGNEPILSVKTVEILDYLIKKGADPYFEDVERNYRTLFHNACIDGNLEIIKYFLEILKVDESKFEKCDCSPLYYAAGSGNLNLVKYLYEHGFTKSKNPFDETALHLACSNGDFEIVKFLVEHGEDVNCIAKNNHKPIDEINSNEDISKSKIYNYLIENGSTFTMEHLYYLLQRTNFENFKNIIEKFPINWNYCNEYGYTLLHYCAQYIKDKNIIHWIGEKSDLNYFSEYERATALHLAFSMGNEVAIRVLMELGADLMARTENGETMMHFAMRSPKDNLLKILFQHKLDINAKDNNGECPIHIFAQLGDGSLAKFLIDNGMNVNSLNNHGYTGLIEICKYNHYYAKDCVEVCLRDLKINPYIRDRRQRIALHYAVENDNIQIVMLLAKYTILDIDAVDEDEETPLNLAKKIKNSIIYKFLLDSKIKQLNLD